MSLIPKVGILGIGFVGTAVSKSFNFHADVVLVDKDPIKSLHKFEDLLECEAIFVCVPSPSNPDGSCNTEALESVLECLKNYKGVIISKTTAPPSVYQKLNDQYPNLVHCPEFLTAANANEDYINGKFAIIGGNVKAYIREAERFIRMSQPNLNIVHYCGIGEASMAKYAINTFLATKVVFMNELYQLCQTTGIDYNLVSHMINNDDRIGYSHMKVPGPDGSFGFGGMCFPKDTEALLKFAEEHNSNLEVLSSAVKKNLLLRLTSEPK